ncbi:MAG: FliH/SctL family protein [Mariprofundaceae bacterium]|nr:FliH/SctL family protein [Mariprofundaceae bacterium]
MSASGFTPLPLKYIEGTVITSPLPDFDQAKIPGQPETDRMRELEDMLNEAQNHAQNIEREAYDKAYAAGEQAGMELGGKRAEQINHNITELLLQCEKGTKRLHERMDEVVVDIAEAIIRHIVDTMIDEHPDYIKQMIAQATRYLPEHQTLSLAVSVPDMTMFERILGDIPNKLIADDNISPGTCRIMASDHDILIDPQAAISECMHHIRTRLLQKGHPSADNGVGGGHDAAPPTSDSSPGGGTGTPMQNEVDTDKQQAET